MFKRIKLWMAAVAVGVAAVAVPGIAMADPTSFAGTLTADSILSAAMPLLGYFWPVVLIVLGIFFAIWGVNWIIAKGKSAAGGGGRRRR